jgi:hypothetical protein
MECSTPIGRSPGRTMSKSALLLGLKSVRQLYLLVELAARISNTLSHRPSASVNADPSGSFARWAMWGTNEHPTTRFNVNDSTTTVGLILPLRRGPDYFVEPNPDNESNAVYAAKIRQVYLAEYQHSDWFACFNSRSETNGVCRKNSQALATSEY